MSRSGLIHLRDANPFPRPEMIVDDELLARITSLPPDPEFRRRPSQHHRWVLVVAVSLAAMAVLSSTAYAISEWVFAESGSVSPQTTKGEYSKAQHALTLPPGYSWPDLHLPADSSTSRGAGGGDAVSAAQHAWEHYWVQAIRDGDTAAQRRSYDELMALLKNNVIIAPAGTSESATLKNPPQGPYAVWADDGGFAYVQEAYKMAAAGQPQRLIEICKANPLPE